MKQYFCNTKTASLVALATFLVSLAALSRFTAEDAFITYRYARNLAEGHGPIFNVGEAINAMTSPLHVMISALLYRFPLDIALANKIMGLAALIVMLWNCRCMAVEDRRAAILLPIVAGPPTSVALWTVGGLETLMLLVAAGTYHAVRLAQGAPPDLTYRRLCVVAGLAFLTRHDSALYFLPLLAWGAVRYSSLVNSVVGWAIGAAIAGSWLLFALLYFGDPLPTSFYIKSPALTALGKNGAYIAINLAASGILFLGLPLLLSGRTFGKRLTATLRQPMMAAIASGLLLIMLYGLTMATHHMMFGFRFFVPYFPAAAWVAVATYLIASSDNRSDPLLILALCAVNLVGAYFTFAKSMDGLSPISEYSAVGVSGYATSMKALEQNPADIAADAQQRNLGRPPIVHTFAGGILPYRLNDAFILERLVSYRHDGRPIEETKPFADYLHILLPRHGGFRDQTCGLADLVPVSEVRMLFDGSPQVFGVYYNPHPYPIGSIEGWNVGRSCPDSG